MNSISYISSKLNVLTSHPKYFSFIVILFSTILFHSTYFDSIHIFFFL